MPTRKIAAPGRLPRTRVIRWPPHHSSAKRCLRSLQPALSTSLRAERSNPLHRIRIDGLLRRFAPRNDVSIQCSHSHGTIAAVRGAPRKDQTFDRLREGAISGAFSSEVDPVRVKKTRQNKESRAPFRCNRNGKGSSQVHRLSRWAFKNLLGWLSWIKPAARLT